MKILFAIFVMLLPQKIKRLVYRKIYGFVIDRTASIGFSIVAPNKLKMGPSSRIGHLNVIKGLEFVSLDDHSRVGNLNWISGFPYGSESSHFSDQPSRFPALILGKHSALTNRHLIDCTDQVSIGDFSTFAGFRSQLLTHSISISDSRQRSGPVSIGKYCFVGTGSILLPNSSLPDCSVLGAGSLLNKKFEDPYFLYAGNPARAINTLDENNLYFSRTSGFVI